MENDITKLQRKKINIKTYLNGLEAVTSTLDSMNMEYLFNNILHKSSLYRLNDFWRYQKDVPILKMEKYGNRVIGWAMFLCDLGEVKYGRADIYFKGILSSSLDYHNNTPFANYVNANDYVIISYGGYASLIKPKIY